MPPALGDAGFDLFPSELHQEEISSLYRSISLSEAG